MTAGTADFLSAIRRASLLTTEESKGVRLHFSKKGLVLTSVKAGGFSAGAELEITEDDLGIRIQRVAAGPRLVKVGKRLVARPTAEPDHMPTIDIAALITGERNRRR